MIRAEGVCKSFDKKEVLTDIDAVFEPGKVNLIIGKSGSGKTVLLKSLIGLHSIDKGKIFYNDRDITVLNNKQIQEIRKELGVVFQGGALFDSLSVLENVKFPLNLFSSMTEKEKTERAIFCLNRVNLNNVENLYPAEISGGMKKRVAIARAIAVNPNYLFCDEPNSGLDPQTSQVIDELIKELTEEYNMTTIVVTHDMNSVLNIGENIYFIYNGQIWWKGDKDSILTTTNKELQDFVFTSALTRRFINQQNAF